MSLCQMSQQIDRIEMTDVLESYPPIYVHKIILRDGTRVQHNTNDKSVLAKFTHPDDITLITEYNKKWEEIEDNNWKMAQEDRI